MAMKIVKLNKKHRLYRNGFTHAARFEGMTYESSILYRLLQDAYPNWTEHDGFNKFQWRAYQTKRGRPFWIAASHEEMLTFAVLKMP